MNKYVTHIDEAIVQLLLNNENLSLIVTFRIVDRKRAVVLGAEFGGKLIPLAELIYPCDSKDYINPEELSDNDLEELRIITKKIIKEYDNIVLKNDKKVDEKELTILVA